MKTIATEKRNIRKNAPQNIIARCNKEISDAFGELCTQIPNLLKGLLMIVVALALVLSNIIKSMIFIGLKALITVPNAIENFLGKAFAQNKNGRIIGWCVRIAIIGFLFFIFLGIVSTVTFPIGKLAILNLSVRNCESSEALVGLLEQKNEIYSSEGITGWIACRTAIEKISFWILSVYFLIMAGLTVSKLSVSATNTMIRTSASKSKRKTKGKYIMG